MATMLQTLLGYLNRVFDKDPHQELAFRVDYGGSVLTWTVADGTLMLISADAQINVSVSLAPYTIAGLAAYLSTYSRLSITGLASDGTQNLSALVLVEGQNSSDQVNGDCLYGYTSLLWAYQAACANELLACQTAIAGMPLEMSTNTADGEWLDFIGNFFNIPRLAGEMDQAYGPRIPAEVIAPMSNGFAIAQAILASTGQPATVTDVVEYGASVPMFNGDAQFDGTYDFNASPEPIYCLFDVSSGYDLLNSSDPNTFVSQITAQVNRLRAAGTFLRTVTISSGVLPYDVVLILAESATGTWTETGGSTLPM